MSADLQGICIWYAAGWCRYGADCRYSHNREQISKKEKKWLQERVGAEPAPKLTENQQKWQIAHVDDFDDDMGQFDPIKSLFDGIEEVNLHNNVGFEEERDRGEDENSHDDTEEEEEDHTLRNKANPLTLGDDDDDDDDDLFSTAPCSSSSTASPHVEYLFILDFEGGGTDTYGADEIIEVPVSLFHVSTLQEISRFHSFVRPRAWSSPQLQKEMGEAGTSHSSNSLSGLLVPEWPQVLQMMESWARENGIHLRDPKEHPASPESSGNSNQKIADTPSPSSSSPSHSPSSPPSVSSLPPPSLSSPSYCFLTCGNWDLGTMVPKQCTRSEIEPPHYFNEWINLKVKENPSI